jgi:cbb3-type cytochrome oxidase cytochrome c subunit
MPTGKLRVWVVVLALTAGLVMPAYRAMAAQDVDIDKMIATAKTAADHQAIADYYKQQAKEAQEQADKHKKMAQDYGMASIGRQATKTHFHQHCEALVRNYESTAKEYNDLAKMHEEMAKAAK